MRRINNLTISEYELPVVVLKEKTGYTVSCPLWKDCYAQGETVEEALNEISLTASSLIELYKEEDLKIPLKLQKTSQKSAARFTLTFPLVVST